MNTLWKIVACAITLIVSGGVASGKEWRGIVPLKSTRVDVERVFGATKDAENTASYYDLPNEIVVFQYQAQTCDHDKFGYGWNVPIGTVVNIGVIPKGTHRLKEYQSGSDFKIDDRGAGFMSYHDNTAGISVETYKDRVTLVEYEPEAAQKTLNCPRLQDCCIDFFHRFDEYERIPFQDEKARLDNYMFQINNLFGRGTIEVRGPSRRAREERMKVAARAKAYLVKQRGLHPDRLLIVDGGFSERAVTNLNIYSIGGIASAIFVFPQPDPWK